MGGVQTFESLLEIFLRVALLISWVISHQKYCTQWKFEGEVRNQLPWKAWPSSRGKTVYNPSPHHRCQKGLDPSQFTTYTTWNGNLGACCSDPVWRNRLSAAACWVKGGLGAAFELHLRRWGRAQSFPSLYHSQVKHDSIHASRWAPLVIGTACCNWTVGWVCRKMLHAGLVFCTRYLSFLLRGGHDNDFTDSTFGAWKWFVDCHGFFGHTPHNILWAVV
jgi:hypothetical protein